MKKVTTIFILSLVAIVLSACKKINSSPWENASVSICHAWESELPDCFEFTKSNSVRFLEILNNTKPQKNNQRMESQHIRYGYVSRIRFIKSGEIPELFIIDSNSIYSDTHRYLIDKENLREYKQIIHAANPNFPEYLRMKILKGVSSINSNNADVFEVKCLLMALKERRFDAEYGMALNDIWMSTGYVAEDKSTALSYRREIVYFVAKMNQIPLAAIQYKTISDLDIKRIFEIAGRISISNNTSIPQILRSNSGFSVKENIHYLHPQSCPDAENRMN